MWSCLSCCFVLNFFSMSTSVHTGPSLLLKHANHITSQGPCTSHFKYWESSILKNPHILPTPFCVDFYPKTTSSDTCPYHYISTNSPPSHCFLYALSALFSPCTCLLLTAILLIWYLYLPLEYILQKRGKLFYSFLHSQC